MSRSQQTAVYNQTKGEGEQAFGDAENSYALGQQDVGKYEDQLGKYAASNPFTPGGEFQTDTNRVLANTADASATAAGARLQGIASRTGQNPNASIAATEAMQQENERNLGGQEAEAEKERIGSEADYNKSVLGATAAPVSMETSLINSQTPLYGHAVGAEEDAAKTPSFMETLEGQLASAGTAFAGGLGKSMGGGGGDPGGAGGPVGSGGDMSGSGSPADFSGFSYDPGDEEAAAAAG